MMITRLVFASLLLFTLPAIAGGNYPFVVNGVKNGNQTILVASNRGPGTVSARIDITGTNVQSDRTSPILVVVPPFKDQEVARLSPATPGSYRAAWKTESMLGNVHATADPDARYRLPYPNGQAYKIGQSPGGEVKTHTTDESRDAVDIDMPEGALITAARDGVVIRVEAGFSNEGGYDPALLDKANSIEIEHADGTIGLYAHMKYGGATVSSGQHVKAGDVIGYSGSTGYSGGPHLHFAIQTTRIDDEKVFSRVTVPFMFYVGDPPVSFSPERGMLAFADYGASPKLPKVQKPVQKQATSVAAVQQPAIQEGQGAAMTIRIPEPVREFASTVPGWAWYVAAAIMGTAVLVIGRRKESRYSRNEPGL